MPNFRAIKNASGATRPGYAGTGAIMGSWRERSRIFRMFGIPPKNPCLNQVIQKVLAKIFLPKEISNPKNPSIILVT